MFGNGGYVGEWMSFDEVCFENGDILFKDFVWVVVKFDVF